jgi:hypothetical protein
MPWQVGKFLPQAWTFVVLTEFSPSQRLHQSHQRLWSPAERVLSGILTGSTLGYYCVICVLYYCVFVWKQQCKICMCIYIYILRYIKICQDTIECDCISILVDCRRHCNSWGYPDHRSWPHGIVASLWPSLGCVPGDHRHAWNNVECRASNQPGPR